MSRIACVGGGPGGLFFATLVKQADPSIQVTVFERNQASDTFGFGVVFSDATLAAIHEADPVLLRGLRDHGRHWDRIEVRLKGSRSRCGGNGMAAITRRTLLTLLQERAAEVGVELRFATEVPSLSALSDYDLVVAADGANSRIRGELADVFAPRVEVATAKFIWFGTTYPFEGLTFVHEKGPHGTFAVHGYPIGDGVGTFIVETDERSWRAAGLDEFDTSQPPGPSDEKSKRYLEKLFADQIDGHELLTNNSRWGNFRTWRTATWHHENVVLLGDAAHTAHFSVGSGTKMAMEDAVALASSVLGSRSLEHALQSYQDIRKPKVARIQDSARPSLSWWEHFGRYHDALDPTRFAFHFLSRSIGRDKLATRDPSFVAAVEQAWQTEHGTDDVLGTPLSLPEHHFPGRLVEISSGMAAGLPLRPAAPPSGPWGLWLTAPVDEAGLPTAFEELARGLADRPALVAVHSGTSLTRVLLAEQARLVHGVPAMIVEPADRDRAGREPADRDRAGREPADRERAGCEPAGREPADGDLADRDKATTLVLSGRADLVGRELP